MVERVGGWFGRHYMGVLALFVALGGTGYAAAKIDSGDIADNAVVSRHVKKNALTGADVKKIKGGDVTDGSLSGLDLAADSVGGDQVDESSLNATRVVARFNLTPNLTLGAVSQPVELPAEWTQRANEFDQFVGSAEFVFPNGCATPMFGFRSASLEILRPDGSSAAIASALPVGAGEQRVQAPFFGVGDALALEPGADTTRTLSGRASASCDAGSTAFPVLSSVNLSVIGNR